MFVRGIFVCVLVGFHLLAKADIGDTIIALDPVYTKGVRFEDPSVGAKLIPIDSFQLELNQMRSLAEVLNQQSFVNLGSLGPGGLATMSIRGNGADHTTIVWNGLNLKPPMSGQLNLSAVNAGMFDQVSIQPGGSSTMYGAGAASGIVFLTNKLVLTDDGLGMNAGVEVGTAETKSINSSIKYSTNNFGTRLNISMQQVANNFEFFNTDRFGDPKERQEHAAYKTLSVVQQNSFMLNGTATLETDIWYSRHFKEIPSLTSSLRPGRDEQRDENLHIAINATKYGNNWFIKYRGGLLHYTIDYLGYTTGEPVLSENRSLTLVNELESKYSFSQSQLIFLGLNSTIDYAAASEYSKDPVRQKLDVFGRYTSFYFSNYLQIDIEARVPSVNGRFIPLVYSGNIKIKTIESVFLKGAGSKLYNLPDLNDLYWDSTGLAAGNPYLEPEYGWNIEAGILHTHDREQLSITHELTVYQNKLFDAIIWAQNDQNTWTPDNYDRSITKGFEFTGKYIFKFISTRMVFAYDYAYTDAMVYKMVNERYEGKPMRYVPLNKAGVRIQLFVKNFSAGTYAQLIEERPIDRAGNYLEPYALVNLNARYRFKIKRAKLAVYLKITNLLDTNYKLRAGYAQPLRGFYTGLIYTL